MRVAMTKPLFAWDCLEDSPNLKTIREFLAAVPDGKLLEALRNWRGHGQDKYPVHTLWGTLLLTVLLRHPSIEACLADLRRNEALRRLIGIESEARVPKPWNISRFQVVLGQEPHLSLLREMFDTMVQTLGEVVPDLGTHTAGDATGLNARRDRRTRLGSQKNTSDASDVPDALPAPAGGRKEYKDDDGKVTKVVEPRWVRVEWFGYKLHLLVDVRHEVILAYRVSSTKRGDNEELPALVEQAQANLPEGRSPLGSRRIETLAYDKAADDTKVHQRLHDARIKPVIQNRALWTGEGASPAWGPERMLPGHDGNSNIVHDERGTVYCYDKVSDPPVRHPMAYIGHEAARGTLKYRCPAMHEGWPCPSQNRCNAGKTYGLTVRVKQEIDLRRFPPIPRATKQFERRYKGRTAVERVNARVKIFWGADDGNVIGAARFHAQVGTVMVSNPAGLRCISGWPPCWPVPRGGRARWAKCA